MYQGHESLSVTAFGGQIDVLKIIYQNIDLNLTLHWKIMQFIFMQQNVKKNLRFQNTKFFAQFSTFYQLLDNKLLAKLPCKKN